jgi:hypothetical protein
MSLRQSHWGIGICPHSAMRLQDLSHAYVSRAQLAASTQAVAEEADVVPSGSQNQLMNLKVEFDNDSDPDATIIKVCSENSDNRTQPNADTVSALRVRRGGRSMVRCCT